MITEEKLTKEQLLYEFETFIISAGFLIESYEDDISNKQFINLYALKHGIRYLFHANIKKIGHAYFPNDDSVLRIQVGQINMESTPENKENQFSILVGITLFNNVPIISIWNSFYFTGHRTNRSCYLTNSNLEETIEEGYCITSYSGTPVYISTKERFETILNEYIQDSKI